MLAYIFIVLAATMRFVTPLTHSYGLWNYSALGASLLFFGARQPRKNFWMPVALFVASDLLLNAAVYHQPISTFQYGSLLYYVIAVMMGSLLREKTTVLRVLGLTVLGSATFFFISNFMVWVSGTMYEHNFNGLVQCFTLAIPFARGTFVGDLVYSTVFFGATALMGIKFETPVEVPVRTERKE